jgi:hypothetical protein
MGATPQPANAPESAAPQRANAPESAGWARDAIFYNIYPLGLCGAPARNDFGAAPVERLDSLLPWLDHIRSLRCNALYIGPLFESTAHGYDTADYWHLDRRLGTDETLRRFVAAAHATGLRVVLDGVSTTSGATSGRSAMFRPTARLRPTATGSPACVSTAAARTATRSPTRGGTATSIS